MGKTASIQDLANRESQYRDYLNKLEDELTTKSTAAEADLQKRIDTYYKNNKYDKINYISGQNTDFMQQSDWSLSNVKKIIDSISKAIFGGGKSALPSGVSVNNDTGVSLSALQHLDIYIAGKCFDVISGIIESFGNASSVSYNHSYKDISLGSGLHLFATVVCDAYQSKDFFKNEEIYQYLYLYQVQYSAAEARKEGSIVVTQLYEDQIATFKNGLEKFLKKLNDDEITLEQYDAFSKGYQEHIDAALEKLNQLKSAAA